MATAVDKSPAYARLSAVAPAGDLPTAPTPIPGTRPKIVQGPFMLLTVRDCCEPHDHVLKDDGRADIEDIALAVRAAEADAEAFFLRNHVTAGMRVLFETGLALI
jgi:hypothetical protein